MVMRKEWRNVLRRGLALALCLCMGVGYVPMPGVAEGIHVHSAQCYSDGVLPGEGEEKAADSCTQLVRSAAAGETTPVTEPEATTAPTEAVTEPTETTTAPTEALTEPTEATTAPTEPTQPEAETTEATEPETEPAEETPSEPEQGEKRILAWAFVDQEGVINPETGNIEVAASQEEPLLFGEILEALPRELTVTLEGGETENLVLDGWFCPGYPAEGAFSGAYTLRAALPQGYGLAEDAPAVELALLFDQPEVLAVTLTKPEKDADGAYLITNVSELYWWAQAAQFQDKSNVSLQNDIVVNNIQFDANGKPLNRGNLVSWTPPCLDGQTFKGNNHTISGLYYVSPDTFSYVGFVREMYDGSTIQDLTIANSYFEATKPGGSMGAICGYASNGKIYNCHNKGSYLHGAELKEPWDNVGGCVGLTYNSTEIKNCSNSVPVEAQNCAGGIVGLAYDGMLLIENCTNTADISAVKYAGGICGSGGGWIKSCKNEGEITSTWSTGGIAALSAACGFDSCVNTGNVKSGGEAGGIAGRARAVESCINSGTIESTDGYVGGVVGYVSEAVVDSLNRGNVTGGAEQNTGSVAGHARGGALGCLSCVKTPGMFGYVEDTVVLCYYLSDKDDKLENTGTIGRTQKWFQNGQLAYLLQGGNYTTIRWGQKIGSEDCPTPRTTDPVYNPVASPCKVYYSNVNEKNINNSHKETVDENGNKCCMFCGTILEIKTPEDIVVSYNGSTYIPTIPQDAAYELANGAVGHSEPGTYTYQLKRKDENGAGWDSRAGLVKLIIQKRSLSSEGINLQIDGTNQIQYTGEQIKPTVTLSVDGNTVSIADHCTVTYSSNINVGTATVTVTATSSGYFTDSKQTTFEIVSAPVSGVVTPTAKKELTYDGADQLLVNGGTVAHGTMSYSLTQNGSYTQNIPVGHDAGEYTVYYKITPDSNFMVPQGQEQGFVKVSIAPIKITVTASADKIYDGSTTIQDLGWKVTSGAFLAKDEAYVSIVPGEARFDSADAGNRKIVFDTAWSVKNKTGVDRAKNYTIVVPSNLNGTIRPAKNEWTTAPFIAPAFVYGEPLEPAYRAAVNNEMAVLEYRVQDETGYSTEVPTAVGSYVLRITVPGTNNYTELVSKELAFTIEKANSVFTTVPTAKQLAYTGEKQTLVTAGETGHGTVLYRLEGEEAWSASIPQAIGAGSYVVFYKIAPDGNHTGEAEGSVPVTVQQKEVTLTAVAKDKAYDGTTAAQVELTMNGVVKKDKDKVTVVPGTAEFAGSTPGTWDVSFTTDCELKGTDGNYTLTNPRPANLSAAISKREISSKGVVFAIKQPWDSDYTGQEKKPELTMTMDSTAYSIADHCEIAYTNNENVGQATATVTAKSSLFTGSVEVSFQITQATNTWSTAPRIANTMTYGRQSAPTYEATFGTSTARAEYKKANEPDETYAAYSVDTILDAGSYVLRITVPGTDNYKALVSQPIAFTIEKADAEFTAIPAKIGLTYTGEKQTLVTAGTTNHGALQYRLEGEETWSAILPQATEEGSYEVFYRIDPDGNHNSTGGSVTVTIAPKPLTLTATVTDKDFDNTATATVELSTGDIVEKDLKNVTLVPGNAEYAGIVPGTWAVTFTSDCALTGTAAHNYVLTNATPDDSLTGTINPGTRFLNVESTLDGLSQVNIEDALCDIQQATGKDGSTVRYIDLDGKEGLVTASTYEKGSGNNTMENYPTGMRVYRIVSGENGATLEAIPEFENLLQYQGCSIRLTAGKKQGIRMLTALDSATKKALRGKEGLAGFTLEEYGTVVARGTLGESLNLATGSHNYAFLRGKADPVFSSANGKSTYTNVLVGFSLDDCKENLTMRPYIVLKDEAGVLHTIYGGVVTRSIGYIAKQNEDTYKAGTAGYKYVHKILDAVADTEGQD